MRSLKMQLIKKQNTISVFVFSTIQFHMDFLFNSLNQSKQPTEYLTNSEPRKSVIDELYATQKGRSATFVVRTGRLTATR